MSQTTQLLQIPINAMQTKHIQHITVLLRDLVFSVQKYFENKGIHCLKFLASNLCNLHRAYNFFKELMVSPVFLQHCISRQEASTSFQWQAPATSPNLCTIWPLLEWVCTDGVMLRCSSQCLDQAEIHYDIKMELEHCWASAFLFFLVWICYQETTETLNISISLHTDTPPSQGNFPSSSGAGGWSWGNLSHCIPQCSTRNPKAFPRQTPPWFLREVSWDCWSVTVISPPLAHTLMAEATHNDVWAAPTAQHILSLGVSLLCTLTTQHMYISLPWRSREPGSRIFFLFLLFWGAFCWSQLLIFYIAEAHWQRLQYPGRCHPWQMVNSTRNKQHSQVSMG